jgi:hypothetical protein
MWRAAEPPATLILAHLRHGYNPDYFVEPLRSERQKKRYFRGKRSFRQLECFTNQ